ncbi:G-protein coupled receptor 26 isoform X2 [Poeciliopsis prolifica]|uniref:G-protein coupled receptor 26 isoform X2 n=1 Tax=Poeciliopsis prolifica TaxID=188132 RepID=UPI0024134F4F|nr:G-protein coupled receptor 26 isoform X2 [Poeciliopsis prolifica]
MLHAELRSHVPGIFTLNLSISNVVLALVNMPATFLGVASSAKPLGDPLCRAVSFTETFVNAMLSMAALSVDTWVAVVFPLRYSSKMRHRDALVIASCSWLHSLAFSLIQLSMGWGAYSRTYASCTLHLDAETASRRSAYVAFTALFHCSSFALCLFVLCFAYLKVLREARSQEDRCRHSASSAPAGGYSPQCKGEVSGPTKDEKAASCQENLHLHRFLHDLLFAVCHNEACRIVALGGCAPSLRHCYQMPGLRQGIQRFIRSLSSATPVQEGPGERHLPHGEEGPPLPVGAQHQQADVMFGEEPEEVKA